MEDSEVVEIFKEEINGIKQFRCPFCEMSPESSDIRFRKHLKKEHPSKKTLLKYSNKTKEYDASLFSILNDKENQALALGLSMHNSKVNNHNSSLRRKQSIVFFVKDADGSPIIVISENPLASPSKEEIPDLHRGLKGSSPKKSNIINETLEQCFDDANNIGVNLR